MTRRMWSVYGTCLCLLIGFLWVGQPASAEEGNFYFGSPCRLFDTRSTPGIGPFTGGPARLFQVGGQCGVPLTATSVVANVTAISTGAVGHLVIWPGDQAGSSISALNYDPGETVKNQLILSLAADGSGTIKIAAAVSGAAGAKVDVAIDLFGYTSGDGVPANASTVGPLGFEPISGGCRLADTRLAGGALGPFEDRAFSAQGNCEIPFGAPAVALNVVGLHGSSPGQLEVHRGDGSPLGMGTVAFGTGAVIANGAMSRLGLSPQGDLKVKNHSGASVHTILDVQGAFTEESTVRYQPVSPCRVYDSRTTGAPLSSGETRSVSAAGTCTPTGVFEPEAAFVNVTVVGPSAAGHLVASVPGQPLPATSLMNFSAGDVLAHGGFVALDGAKRLALTAAFAGPGQVHVIVDVFGYLIRTGSPREESSDVDESHAHPNVAAGFQPGKTFSYDNLDSVNLFNGNLTVQIPVSLTYPVGPALSYGFNLIYNSSFWRFGSASDDVILEPGLNAGAGWQVSLGRLDGDDVRWTYIGPDGGQHVFFRTLHPSDLEDDGDVSQEYTGAQTYRYTRDGSYLRLIHRPAAGFFPTDPAFAHYQHRLEAPDGTIHFFSAEGRLLEIRDRNFTNINFPSNWVRFAWSLFTHEGEQVASQVEVTDSASPSRRNTIYFTAAYPEMPETIDRLEVATFSPGSQLQTLRVKLNYESVVLQKAGHPESLFDPTVHLITVPVLRSVVFGSDTAPLQVFDQMEYIEDEDCFIPGATCRESGALTHLRLPTGGGLAWTWQIYHFPGTSVKSRKELRHSIAVEKRRTLDAAGGVLGEWDYEPLSNLGELREWVVQVTDPLGHQTRSYFSIWSDEFPSGGWTRSEYGQPFTRNQSRNGHFLSREVYAKGATGAPVRQVFVRPDYDFLASGIDWEEDTTLNHRQSGEITVFLDDCASGCGTTSAQHRWTSVSRTEWDHFGHYRVEELGGNFGAGGGDYRWTKTDFNPGALPRRLPSQPWVLDTFSSVETKIDLQGADRSFTSFNFDTAKGQLASTRIHLNGDSSPNGLDVLTNHTRNANGFVTRTERSGAERQVTYRIDHTIDCGLRATSTPKNPAAPSGLTFKTLDLNIDCESGLVQASRDITGLQTNYTYTGLGWPVDVSPPGEATIHHTYVLRNPTSPTSFQPHVTIQRLNGSTVLDTSEIELDPLGRELVTKHERSQVVNGALTKGWDAIRRSYDPAGNLAAVRGAEWYRSAGGGPCAPGSAGCPKDTKYEGYDPFGRPTQILAPDGTATKLSYRGAFSVEHTVRVGRRLVNGNVQQTDAKTTQILDRQGRLWKVIEPSDDAPDGVADVRCRDASILGGIDTNPADCDVTTVYSYDEGNRLVKVQILGDSVTQTRDFDYDRRGFLTSESHPELDSLPSGVDVVYENYDALGNPGRRRGVASDLFFLYDGAGRPTETWQPWAEPDPENDFRLLTRLAYGTSNSAKNNGKVIQSTAYNYRNPGIPVVAAIQHDYSYTAPGGRVSQRTTRMLFGTGDGEDSELAANESFTTDWTYDLLGQVTSILYPQCTLAGVPCLNTPARRQITYQYRESMLVKVPGYTGQVHPAAIDGITYHANGLWNQVKFANGWAHTQELDPAGMARPHRYVVTGGPQTVWLGPYKYDGAGNIVEIGSFVPGQRELYLYDRVSRLWKATLTSGDNQQYVYDAFGNLQEFVSSSGHGRNTPTSQLTNRLISAGYDGAGRMNGWNGSLYFYDGLGNLASLQTAGASSEIWHHVYDADGERIWSYSPSPGPGIPAKYRWTLRGLDGKVLREYTNDQGDGSWANGKDYIYRGSSLLASVSPQEGVHYFHTDHLGSPRVIADASASQGGFHFLPFGEQVNPDGNLAAERMRFTGHERDLHNGGSFEDDLDYMHARYYNPKIGRFLSPDPFLGQVRTPQGWNRFSYSEGGPITRIDPDGRNDVPVAHYYETITVTMGGAWWTDNTDFVILNEFFALSQSGGLQSLGAGDPDFGAHVLTRAANMAEGPVNAAAAYTAVVSGGLAFGVYATSATGVTALGLQGAQIGGGSVATGATAVSQSGAVLAYDSVTGAVIRVGPALGPWIARLGDPRASRYEAVLIEQFVSKVATKSDTTKLIGKLLYALLSGGF